MQSAPAILQDLPRAHNFYLYTHVADCPGYAWVADPEGVVSERPLPQRLPSSSGWLPVAATAAPLLLVTLPASSSYWTR